MNMSLDLNFLKDVELTTIKKATTVERTSKIPGGCAIRVYVNGNVYPSKEMAEKFDFTYHDLEESIDKTTGDISVFHPGNGLSIFKSGDWGQFNSDSKLLFAAIIPRDGNSGINMFNHARYKEGTVIGDVFTPSKSNFSKQLLDMLSEYHEINWDITEYVEITINSEYPMTSANSMYHVPRMVTRGKHAGTMSYNTYSSILVLPIELDKVVFVDAPQAEEGEPTPEEVVPVEVTDTSVDAAQQEDEAEAEVNGSVETVVGAEIPADVVVEIEAVQKEEEAIDEDLDLTSLLG